MSKLDSLKNDVIDFLQDVDIEIIKKELTEKKVKLPQKPKKDDLRKVDIKILEKSEKFQEIRKDLDKKDKLDRDVYVPEIIESVVQGDDIFGIDLVELNIHKNESRSTKTANDFYQGMYPRKDLGKKQTISVNEKYQRKFIWTKKEMIGLIETILLEMPIQEVYLKENEYVDPDAGSDMMFMIIDGQQRITSIVKYMNDDFKMNKSGLSYPDASYANKKFTELHKDLQIKIKNYKITCRHIPTEISEVKITDDVISKIFLRLNKTAKSLNKAELRHAKYFGYVDQFTKQITQDDFWNKYKLFKKNAQLRKLDESFVAKLLIIAKADNEPLKDKYISAFYEKFDADKKTVTKLANLVLWAMEKSEPYLERPDVKEILISNMNFLLTLFDVLISIKILKTKTPQKPELIDEFIELMKTVSELKSVDIDNISKKNKEELIKENEIRQFKIAKSDTIEDRLKRKEILKKYIK